MSTLSQIYVTLISGVVIATGSFVAFGMAVRFEGNSNLVPRAWSRPVQVVKNNLGGPYCISWVAWAIRQKYIDLLAGIPGTGTRVQGWSGPTLRTNLDGIVLLRYHVLMLKVSIVASVICMLILLPLYYTVPCDPIDLGLNSCINQANLTDFEVLTIANVPSIAFNPFLNQTTYITVNDTYTVVVQPRTDPINPWEWINGLTGRYAAFALTVVIVTWYTCYLLWHEWIECLALRRVYYLEAEYYPERLEELDELQSNQDPEEPFQKVRPPYLPHPEMRETIPNVSLNSVLYQLPDKLKYAQPTPKNSGSADDTYPLDSPTSNPMGDSLIERQLAATVEFFDQCVPNQPGFTSSVVAVTIIPDATLVASAWIKWYQCGKKLRRLRYIKSVLEERKRMEREGIKSLYDYVDSASKVPGALARATADAVTHVAEKSKEEMEHFFCADRNHPSSDEDDDDDKDAAKDGEKGPTPPVPVPSSAATGNDEETGSPPIVGTDNEDVPSERKEEGTPLMTPSKVEASNLDGESGIPPTTHTEAGAGAGAGAQDGKSANEKNGPSGGLSGLFSWMNPNKKDGDRKQSLNDPKEGDDINDTTTTHKANIESIYHDAEIGPSTLFQVGNDGNDGNDEEPSAIFVDARPDASTGLSGRPSGSTIGRAGAGGGLKVNDEETMEHFEYKNFDPQEFAKWIGYSEETQLDQLVDTLGVEQLSVYSREMSQSASNLGVYGLGFKSLRLSSIEELEVMLEDAWAAVREANADLLETRARIFRELGAIDEEMPTRSSQTAHKTKDDVPSPNSESYNKQLSPLSIESDDKQGAHLEAVSEHDDDSDDEEAVPLRSPASVEPRGLRKRVISNRAKYNAAQSLVKHMQDVSSSAFNDQEVDKRSFGLCRPKVGGIKRGALKAGKALTAALDHPSYAVVTFTSRQSAIAARQCLADGRGIHRWSQVDDIPTAPLADAPPCKPFFCRGFCRPVTLTLNYKEKKVRKIVTWVSYIFFCCLYTVPLALTSAVLNPTYLAQAFPDSQVFQNPDSVFYRLFAGISSGMLYTLFFSVLPQIFKLFANFEGTSSSVPRAENHALRFYWYFMLLTAFTGSTLAQMLLDGFVKGDFEGELRDGLQTVARTIPTQQAPVWLNWILVRTGNTLPLMYLLQFNTWLYGCLRMKCLNRAMRGGGPGGPPPYRIYIDGGTVFMCITSLAPCCPIIAPAATLYYLMCIPIHRWLLIFVYRPKYDAGGNKLPYLHEILISSLILGQILSAVVILLKQAVVPAGFIFLLTIPTFLFSQWTKEKFEKSYNDAGLLQTSMLDGWDEATLASRERYRAWLVDTHKASYVPICLSGGEDFLTSQPAVTVPTQRDLDYDEHMRSERTSLRPGIERQDAFRNKSSRYLDKATSQKGAVFRRYVQYQ